MVIEVVGERCVNFGGLEMRVLTYNLLGGPPVANVIGYNLRHAYTRQAFQPGDSVGGLVDMRIFE